MKIAIMQPYFFPYIGYFSLIKNTDYFVFFDTPQYIRKGWVNRNRIAGLNGDEVFITVPIVKTPRETAIKDVIISQSNQWKERIFGQLTVYKKRAPYYEAVKTLIQDVILDDCKTIAQLSIKSVIKTCEYLDIKIEYDIFSKMNLNRFVVEEPDEWALNITKQLGFDTYVNPPGGKSFFQPSKYEKENINLEFLVQEMVEYNQKKEVFIPGLSIIDVLMYCKPQEVMEMFNHYKLER